VSGDYQFSELVAEAGLSCSRCGAGACGTYHGRWCRKQVQELSTGDVFLGLPILRVAFCSGDTSSIYPAGLWRGRSTLGSVLQAVSHAWGEGVGPALEWAAAAGSGEEPISERTLRRWMAQTHSRLIGSAFSWLGKQLGWSWSGDADASQQLDRLLKDLTADHQLAFRGAFGRGLFDQASVEEAPSVTDSSARPVPGRLAEAPPQEAPSILLPRGQWSSRTRRGPAPEG